MCRIKGRDMSKDEILTFLKENKTLLETKYQVKKIGLFGSYVKNQQHKDSDIDLIVEMPSSFDVYYDLKEFLEMSLKKPIDLGIGGSIRKLIRSEIEDEVIYV